MAANFILFLYTFQLGSLTLFKSKNSFELLPFIKANFNTYCNYNKLLNCDWFSVHLFVA